MNLETTEAVTKEFPGQVLDSHAYRGDETMVVKAEALKPVALFLRDRLGFEFLLDLTAVDHPDRALRFDLVCHFYSFSRNKRFRLKVPVGGAEPSVASLTGLWPVADWFEREVYDFFGIKFEGHRDLRRIMLYDGFQGHPLRKDYPLRQRQPRMPHED